jgi:hypothetical protein
MESYAEQMTAPGSANTSRKVPRNSAAQLLKPASADPSHGSGDAGSGDPY